ncbi:uncharacterized protein LOC134144287 [Rhea pennata]|uniref:uncharacterized protein LOC134144287 n=1 Tax=Rhea pennata TaxID=8795 RepID=UPI002E2701AB
MHLTESLELKMSSCEVCRGTCAHLDCAGQWEEKLLETGAKVQSLRSTQSLFTKTGWTLQQPKIPKMPPAETRIASQKQSFKKMSPKQFEISFAPGFPVPAVATWTTETGQCRCGQGKLERCPLLGDRLLRGWPVSLDPPALKKLQAAVSKAATKKSRQIPQSYWGRGVLSRKAFVTRNPRGYFLLGRRAASCYSSSAAGTGRQLPPGTGYCRAAGW